MKISNRAVKSVSLLSLSDVSLPSLSILMITFRL